MQLDVKLTTIDDVKNFCNAAMKCNSPVDAIRGNYRVDGTSLMGLLSLDLTKPVTLEFDDEDFKDEIKDWLVK